MEDPVANINLRDHILCFLRLFTLLEELGKVFGDTLEDSGLMEVFMAVGMDALSEDIIALVFLAVADGFKRCWEGCLGL